MRIGKTVGKWGGSDANTNLFIKEGMGTPSVLDKPANRKRRTAGKRVQKRGGKGGKIGTHKVGTERELVNGEGKNHNTITIVRCQLIFTLDGKETGS